jgi:serine/threonine protein kinase
VGTYLQKNTFAILLYPVATGDLAKFLEEWQPDEKGCYRDNSPWRKKQIDLGRFFFCLTHALCYMHDQGIRHMDIKPSNILVHERRSFERPTVRTVYL